ncbi:MAG: TIGR03617 family F420-dependent LLM class oxidoreductase [Dehalococcoidia bacterium]|nr:TIGR03617 family F420-dependent LLM class oxidoreductase [Dehalococcoidia bacterium]
MKIDARFALDSMPLRDVPRVARAAEALGLDALWSSQTTHDPYLPLALAAESTSRIQVGTAIALAFTRSPMETAYTAWDMQALSGGRFLLGLGSQVKGHNERRFSVKWEAPAPRMAEVVQSLRAIWTCWQTAGPLDFKGKLYNFSLMTPYFSPGPIAHPHIPVYISAVNPAMLHVAGQYCDGVHIHPMHTARYLRDVALPAIAVGSGRSGRQRKDVVVSSMPFVVTGRNREEMEKNRQETRRQIAFYASTPAYKIILELHGWDYLNVVLGRKAIRGEWQDMANEISDEMLEEFAVVGTPDEIGPKLKAKYEGLLDRVALYTPFDPGQHDELWKSVVQAAKE